MEYKHELVLPNDDLPFKIFIFEGKEGNYRVVKHWHQSIEIFLVLEGAIDFYMNASHYPLYRNQFVLVNSNEIHSIHASLPNYTLVLQIPVQTFDRYWEEDGSLIFRRVNTGRDTEITKVIEDIFRYYQDKEYGGRMMVKSLFYKLLYMLLVYCREENVDEEWLKQTKKLEKLSKITYYIKQNYNQELTLDQVASRFGFSPPYLSRMFQKYAGVNYKTFLQNIRVEYGFKDLLNTDKTIGEIALNNGFPNSKAFSKIFERRYGCLPSEYRKKQKIKKCH